MADNVLVTRGLCKRYGATMAVDHVDLRVEHGQIYAVSYTHLTLPTIRLV